MTDEQLSIGTELARAREARGLSVAELAQQLKYGPRQIEALEQERFEALPGATITRGMVRNYARLVRIDPGPLLERLAGRLAVPDSERLATRYREPVPFSDNARRSTMIYLLVSLGVLVIGASVVWEWYGDAEAVRQPAVVAAASQTLDAPTAPEPAPVATELAPVATDAPAPEADVRAAAPAPMQAPAQEKKTEEKKAEEKAIPSGSRRIALQTEEEAWIEVKDGADRLLVSSLNPAGTERVVYGRPPFSLVIGNAQHVRVLYDDKPVDLIPYVKVEVARFTLK